MVYQIRAIIYRLQPPLSTGHRLETVADCRRLSPTVADSIRNVVATNLDGFVVGVRDVNWCPDPTNPVS